MRVKDTLSLAVVLALYAAPFAVAVGVAAEAPRTTNPVPVMKPSQVWAEQIEAMNSNIILSSIILTNDELTDQPVYGDNGIQVGTITEIESGGKGTRDAVIELPGQTGPYDPLLYVSLDHIFIAKDGRLVMTTTEEPANPTLEGV